MKKAMVFGAGVSGLGAYRLLEKIGYDVILVDDKKGVSSKEGLEYLDEIEIFIKSPGVPYNELVIEAQRKGIEVIDEIELSYRYMIQYMDKKSKIVAITGTNGKTTTTTKVTELLKYAGYKAEYAGNIGVSFADLLLKNDDLNYVVLELSSYQLENLDSFKADIALIINLAPDHLSRYKSVDEYYDTKFNIGKNQTLSDYFILNNDSEEIIKRSNFVSGRKIFIGKNNNNCDFSIKNDILYKDDTEILKCSKLTLKGEHNRENVLFIVAIAKILNIGDEKIREFLYTTGNIEHRMEEFFNYGKIKFINDSKGTNIDSTKFAVEAFKNCILICGGFDKKLDWLPLIELIKAEVKEVYLIGDIADQLNEMLLENGYDKNKIYLLRDLKSCLLNMRERLDKNREEVVLLSPATSSFDQFKSFEHRGEVFKDLVREIFGR